MPTIVPVNIRPMAPPSTDDALQPLREIGCDTKTRFWDIEEIQAALRTAHLRGIRPESLFSQNQYHTPVAYHKTG